jgi:hypothetical protein
VTRAKGGPEVATPKAEPVAPDEVVGWFHAAGVTGADPAAAAGFAAVVEEYRAHNGRPADDAAAMVAKLKAVNAGGDALRAFRLEAEALTRSLFALWAGPAAADARSPAMAALLFALLDVCKMPAPRAPVTLRRKPHRSMLQSTAQTIVLSGRLAALLPPDATIAALRSILRAARKRCGWKDLPSAEIGKLLVRSRSDRAALLAQTLVAWPVSSSSAQARPAKGTSRKKVGRRC